MTPLKSGDPAAAKPPTAQDLISQNRTAAHLLENSGYGGARLAATVLLIRDGPNGIEVWVQERVSSMPNFPGFTVFPGGGVDARDFPVSKTDPATSGLDHSELWVGPPSIQHRAKQLGISPQQVQAIYFAAVRELFEETGTFLAIHGNAAGDHQVLADAGPFHSQRLQLASHEISLTEVLQKHNLRLDSSLLYPWARWVGGSEKGTVFDTFSFLVSQPVGQEPDDATSEVDSSGWFPPQLLLDGWRAGLVRLVIPTWAQLYQLAEYKTVAAALADAREIQAISPVLDDAIADPRYQEFYQISPEVRI
ncbi:NUDIX hydrolase [Corynebacterium caspium]|uniref:NUDIX hydrolase n=1 Tax=Corynebacterium caspium TaxID=234828 RepID=UPI00037A3681|nr:hypothetical protein [Corynebacterium caspium]WKD59439.1 NUDIX domain protein [Corynebacterium caspium DSM 44850]